MSFLPIASLETDRLLLRPFTQDDAPEVEAACSDDLTQRWLPLPRPYTAESARWWCLEGAPRSRESGDGIQFAAEDRETGRLAGCFGFKATQWIEQRTEIGYWVSPWARGRGLAAEAVRTVCRWGLTGTPIRRISLLAATANTASQRVAEKAGFVREGVLREAGAVHGGRVDYLVYGLIPSDLPTRETGLR
jgi:RimJ/RimL family protein N-acetyltransferase